jgi:hypothetical protein
MLPDKAPKLIKPDPGYVKRESLKSDLYQRHKAVPHLSYHAEYQLLRNVAPLHMTGSLE